MTLNTGCCTANFNQGWPKFASMIIQVTPDDGGAVVALWAPASAVLPSGGTIDVDGEYPFDDVMTVTVNASKDAIPLQLRIPSWATAATVNGTKAANGTMYRVVCDPLQTTVVTIRFNPEIRLERWTKVDAMGANANGSVVSIHRGALMYSMPIQGNFTQIATWSTEGADYEVVPADGEKWAVALDMSHTPLSFVRPGYKDGAAPFNHTEWPCYIDATVRDVSTWKTLDNSAAPPPTSPACNRTDVCGKPRAVRLVPHGGTDLRIGEMPLAYGV